MANTTRKTSDSRQASPKANAIEGAPKDNTKALEHIQGAQAGIDHPAAAEAAAKGENPVTATAAALKEQQQQDTAGLGHNRPGPLGELRIEITEGYKPTLKDEDAILKAIAEVTRGIQSNTNEIEGSQTAMLANLYADETHYMVNLAKPPMPVTSDFADRLVTHVKDKNIFGDPKTLMVALTNEVTEDDKTVTLETTQAESFDPWRDRNMAAKHKDAAMKGALIAVGGKSNVTFGYVAKGKVSGRRFTREMVFSAEPEGKVEDCFRVICVPYNVVNPYRWKVLRDDPSENHNIARLEPGEARQNAELHYLTTDWAYALYQHHFNRAKLVFDVGPSENKIPTGLLLREATNASDRGARGKNRDRSEPLAIPKNNDEIKKLDTNEKVDLIEQLVKTNDMLTAAVNAGKPANRESFMANARLLVEMLRDKGFRAQISPSDMAELLSGIALPVLRSVYERFGNTKPDERYGIGRAIVALSRELDGRVTFKESSGAWHWLSESGNDCGVIATEEKANTKAA